MSRSIEKYYIDLLIGGNKEGLNWIFENYKELIYHYIFHFLKQKDLTEEATADVFIKIWQKRAIIQPELGIKALIYKIAKDTAYNYLKKIASDERLKQKYIENYQHVNLEDGEWEYLKKEHFTMVSKIVDSLPDQRKIIFIMKYFEGKNNQEIANHLNLSIHTVKSQLTKAKVFVKKQLQQKGELKISVFILFTLLCQ